MKYIGLDFNTTLKFRLPETLILHSTNVHRWAKQIVGTKDCPALCGAHRGLKTSPHIG